MSGLASASQERRKERMRRMGRNYTPDNDRSEVGPGHDLVASRIWCVELDSNAQTADSHRSLGAEALYGLQETPSGHSTQLDLVLIQHGRSTDNAPPVVETLHDRESLSQRNYEFVREDRVKELLDLSSVGLRRGDCGGH